MINNTLLSHFWFRLITFQLVNLNIFLCEWSWVASGITEESFCEPGHFSLLLLLLRGLEELLFLFWEAECFDQDPQWVLLNRFILHGQVLNEHIPGVLHVHVLGDRLLDLQYIVLGLQLIEFLFKVVLACLRWLNCSSWNWRYRSARIWLSILGEVVRLNHDFAWGWSKLGFNLLDLIG